MIIYYSSQQVRKIIVTASGSFSFGLVMFCAIQSTVKLLLEIHFYNWQLFFFFFYIDLSLKFLDIYPNAYKVMGLYLKSTIL